MSTLGPAADNYDGDLFTAGRHPHTEAFLRFHADNPQVFEKLVEYARDARRAGLRRLGLSTIYGRLRWYFRVEVVTDDIFEMNDHHAPFYARLLVIRHPEFEGMFEFRSAIADHDNWTEAAA